MSSISLAGRTHHLKTFLYFSCDTCCCLDVSGKGKPWLMNFTRFPLETQSLKGARTTEFRSKLIDTSMQLIFIESIYVNNWTRIAYFMDIHNFNFLFSKLLWLYYTSQQPEFLSQILKTILIYLNLCVLTFMHFTKTCNWTLKVSKTILVTGRRGL
jgi:hypothetical protein